MPPQCSIKKLGSTKVRVAYCQPRAESFSKNVMHLANGDVVANCLRAENELITTHGLFLLVIQIAGKVC